MHPASDVTNRNFFYKKLSKNIDFCKNLVYNDKQKGGVESASKTDRLGESERVQRRIRSPQARSHQCAVFKA